MNSYTSLVMAMCMLVSTSASAQESKSVAGTWILKSASATSSDGSVNKAPFGESPSGMIIYGNDGWMTAVVTYSGRKPLSADRAAAPVAERAEAFATFFAYAGHYAVEGDRVTHHVEMSSVQNWVGTDLVRKLKFDGDKLVLTTPQLSVNGKQQVSEIVWERLAGRKPPHE